MIKYIKHLASVKSSIMKWTSVKMKMNLFHQLNKLGFAHSSYSARNSPHIVCHAWPKNTEQAIKYSCFDSKVIHQHPNTKTKVYKICI